ncbi:MAG: Fic family protein [Bacteroidales bacterium]|jgi:Fic family protein|nr:Fic family protein [Bacteroidales bacterium]
MYNWQSEKWAEFVYNEEIISNNALRLAELSGEVFGIFKTFNSAKQQNEILDIMISEAIKTSEIEGEMLSREDVRSSFLKKLGLTTTIKNIKDRRAENVALLMLEVRNNFQTKLSEKLIKQWHGMLFSNAKYIDAGVYRSGEEPMQIVSGAIGKEKVHFEAPPSSRVPQEMKNFVKWYNAFKTNGNILKIIAKASITHLYFESIHPFEDGNGRIGRALIEKCLSESLGRQIIMSISQSIEKNKNRYYDEMKKAQHTLEIDSWLLYFSQLLIDAQQNALDILDFSIRKTQFFDKYKPALNERQTKAINKMLDAGKGGFEGGMTAKKYISIAGTTKATATRDLTELVELGILEQNLAGRSTNYTLDLFKLNLAKSSQSK